MSIANVSIINREIICVYFFASVNVGQNDVPLSVLKVPMYKTIFMYISKAYNYYKFTSGRLD